MKAWHEEARAMKAAEPHLSDREIAVRFGVTRSAVTKVLDPERTRRWNREMNAKRGPAKRAWDRQWARSEAGRTRCQSPLCDNLCGIGSARKDPRLRGYCQSCVGDIADIRRSVGEGVWAAGWTVPEFYEVIGVQVGMCRLRGWDLPYRNRTYAGRRLP